MHAALITGSGKVELREFPEPEPVANGAVVDIAFCGICGTDIHAFQTGAPYNPAICGHEWTGIVTAIGREVSRLSEGDRVVVAVPPACGHCAACRAGQASHCSTSFLVMLGRDPLAPPHGGFAPRIPVGATRLLLADPTLDDETLAQVEPTTVAFHAVRRSGVRLGDTAVVQGAGPIGLTTLQWVRAAGAGQIIVVEPNARRRVLAAELGATVTVTPAEAEAQAADMLKAAEADARRLEEDAKVKLEEALARRQPLAERRIAQAAAQAAAAVKSAAAELAIKAAEDILAARLASQDRDPLADDAIAQMATRLN